MLQVLTTSQLPTKITVFKFRPISAAVALTEFGHFLSIFLYLDKSKDWILDAEHKLHSAVDARCLERLENCI